MESYDISDNIGPGNPDTPGKRGLSALPAVVGMAVAVDLYAAFSLLFGDGISLFRGILGLLLLLAGLAGGYFAIKLQKALKNGEEAGNDVPFGLSLFFLANAAMLLMVTAQFLRA